MKNMKSHSGVAAGTLDGRHILDRTAVRPDLTHLVDAAISTIDNSKPPEDAILGDFSGLASLARSVSVHEGRLLEEAIACIARTSPALLVLPRLRLPVTKTALEAVRHNRIEKLKSLAFDRDSVSRDGYLPDVAFVDLKMRVATILDIKRSTVSYGDTSRLEGLRTRMLAASLVLPDHLYKEHGRLAVDEVRIGIVDGSSRQHDVAAGVWPLSAIDDVLAIDGAAAVLDEMRQVFGVRVRDLLRSEARKVPGVADTSADGGEIISLGEDDDPDELPAMRSRLVAAAEHRSSTGVTPWSVDHDEAASPRAVRFGVLQSVIRRSA